MRETAPAKINLALHVRRRRPDDYHDLETIFAFAEDGDRLEAEPADDLTLEVTGPFAKALDSDEGNLVLRAARRLRERVGRGLGARLRLEKRLPVASGLGGGSADAGATLRLLARMWRLQDPNILREIAVELGADVLACLEGQPSRGTGRGDELVPADIGVRGAPLILAAPPIPLSTADVFARWDGVDKGPLGDWRAGRNDLAAAAMTLAPEIEEILRAFRRAELARMSGSGAACFGLYTTLEERRADAERMLSEHPEWWVLETRLRG